MASKKSGVSLPIFVIVFIQIWISCHSQSIDQEISMAMETSVMSDFLQDNDNVLVELDMKFKSRDWMEIVDERIPFEDEDGEGGDDELEEARRRRRDIAENERTRRNAIRQVSKRWSNNIMPYQIAPGTFNSAQMGQINSAIADYNRYTCLSLRRRTNQRNYVYLQNGGGCSSYVGMIGGRQPVSLAYGCRRKGIVAHELGHAAGFHHEQTRPDRDRYVRILRQNIPSSVLYNFQKYSTAVINTYSVPYDYTSMMHYGQYAFSTNGRATIQTLDRSKQHLIGNRRGFSFRDVKLLNLMYNCASRCGSKTCPGEGFVGKDCKCYCPGNPVKECSGTGTGGGGTGTGGGGTGTGGGGTGGSCKNLNTNCAYWAAKGECNNYKAYMGKNCRAACKLCSTGGGGTGTGGGGTGTGGGGTGTGGSSCKDNNRYCSSWARRGECRRNPRYMLVNCKKSCRRCGGSSSDGGSSSSGGRGASANCRDHGQHCRYWKRIGQCTSNPAYMHVSCKRSCGLC